MKIPVKSVLFKRGTQINMRALTGKERGQYDLRLRQGTDIADFFDSVPIDGGSNTDLGGWTKTVSFEPMTGTNPVPTRTIRFRYMGPKSQRKDFYFASQTTDTYDLWKPGRAFPAAAEPQNLEGAVVIIVKDLKNGYHARWVRSEDVASLPSGLRMAIQEEDTGVWSIPAAMEPPPLSPAAQRVLDALHTHYNVLLYGPPATGKTHIVREVLQGFIGTGVAVDTNEERRPLIDSPSMTHAAWATFHQSYSYEDFIVGLRPDPGPEGGFTLEPVAGVLLELAEWARTPGRSSLLIIDEINRGNVSRIFGEFITLLETDKRLADDGSETQTTVKVRLPYVRPEALVKVRLPDNSTQPAPSPFSMPLRVYTLATMNSVDKSVAPLDAALRRRFHLINLFPDLSAMKVKLGINAAVTLDSSGVPASIDTGAEVKQLALVVLAQLNKAITMFLGSDFQFGEWYLSPLLDTNSAEEAKAILTEIWQTSLMPQLEEYFLGRNDQLLALLGPAARDSQALTIDEPPVTYEELGAAPSVRGRVGASDDEVLALLRGLALVNI